MADDARPVVPVLEIGGTHVTSALVRMNGGQSTVLAVERADLRRFARPEEFTEQLVAAAELIDVPPGSRWGIAIPGPFDYQTGVGRFAGVGKFDVLDGFALGEALTVALALPEGNLRFCNDADAFGMGAWMLGEGGGAERTVFLTLGTGVGSAFLDNGRPVNSGEQVPPEGCAHRVIWEQRPLEEHVSRRALVTAYAAATGRSMDVHDMAVAARQGDPAARDAFWHAMTVLGLAMAPWVARFDATSLVVGGSIAKSWDLLEESLLVGLAAGLTGPPPEMSRSALGEEAALVGAALWSLDGAAGAP